MAAKTNSGSGFRLYSCSPPSTWSFQVKMSKIFLGALFWDIWGQSWKLQKLFKWVTRISHSRMFDILPPLWPSTTAPKFIYFHPVINFLQRSAFWDLADFPLIFRVSELPKVCAFISQKLNKLRPWFFIFPNNFCRSIRIWKNVPPGGHGSGATAPPKRFQKPKFQNFHFFAWPLSQNALRQRLRTGFVLHPAFWDSRFLADFSCFCPSFPAEICSSGSIRSIEVGGGCR